MRSSSDSSYGHDISIRTDTTDDSPRPVPVLRRGRLSTRLLEPREVIRPVTPEQPGLRRSTRNRIAPVRQWLGEKAVYKWSPIRGHRLVGTNSVEVKDQNLLRFGTNDPVVVAEQRRAHQEYLRETREERRKEARLRKKKRVADLKRRHKRGIDLDVTVDSIQTSESEQEEDEDEMNPELVRRARHHNRR